MFQTKTVILLVYTLTIHAWGATSSPLSTLDRGTLQALVDQDPDNLEAHFQLGVRYHQAAQADCEASLDKALHHFAYVYAANASRHDARAFYGSAIVLKAKYAGMMSKLKYAREGFAILDRTVASQPNDFAVRLVRAANSIHCPAFLNRGDVAQEDVDWLLHTITNHPETMPPSAIKIARFYAGKLALKNRDSQSLAYLEKALNMPCVTIFDAHVAQTYQRAKKKFAAASSKRITKRRPHQ